MGISDVTQSSSLNYSGSMLLSMIMNWEAIDLPESLTGSVVSCTDVIVNLIMYLVLSACPSPIV